MSDVDQVIADAIRLSERLGLIQPDSVARNIVSALKMEGYTVNLETEPKEEIRTPAEWSTMYGTRVLDPDGWRIDGKSWDTPISRSEWERRWGMSTVTTVWPMR